MTEKPNKSGSSRRRNRGRRNNKNRGDKQKSPDNRPKLSTNQKSLDSSFEKKPKLPNRCFVKFYDSYQQAREDQATLLNMKAECDQLNIIIKEEAPVNEEALIEDPELTKYGKVFAGAAWTMIHKRRVEESFYANETAPEKPIEAQTDQP
jgi:hypothetical protein